MSKSAAETVIGHKNIGPELMLNLDMMKSQAKTILEGIEFFDDDDKRIITENYYNTRKLVNGLIVGIINCIRTDDDCSSILQDKYLSELDMKYQELVSDYDYRNKYSKKDKSLLYQKQTSKVFIPSFKMSIPSLVAEGIILISSSIVAKFIEHYRQQDEIKKERLIKDLKELKWP